MFLGDPYSLKGRAMRALARLPLDERKKHTRLLRYGSARKAPRTAGNPAMPPGPWLGCPVYVDQMLPCVPNPRWKWTENCHLFVEHPHQVPELVTFAVRLGLQAGWLQRRPGKLAHFELTAGKRAMAIKMGAKDCGREFVGQCLKAWREQHKNRHMNVPRA